MLVLMLMPMLMSHASVDLPVLPFVLPCAYGYAYVAKYINIYGYAYVYKYMLLGNISCKFFTGLKFVHSAV